MKDINLKNNSGFTLLLSVLVASIILALGISIFNILSWHVMISDIGKQSQFAFYAADAGVDCALYHDYKKNLFSTTTADAPDEISCLGDNYNVKATIIEDGCRQVFYMPVGSGAEPHCVEVTIEKVSVGSNLVETTLTSKGYNRGWSESNDCSESFPRKIERAVRLNY